MNSTYHKLLTLLLCTALCLSLLPGAWADSTFYDPDSAISYAKNKVSNYSGSNQCANFVSACLRAGGLTSVNETYAANLYNTLIGLGYQSEVLNGYIKYSSYNANTKTHTGWDSTVTVSNNPDKVKKGDVVFYVRYDWRNDSVFYADNNKHYLYHAVICNGKNGNAYTCYGASPVWTSPTDIGAYSSGYANGDKIALIVMHMEYNDPTPDSPNVTVTANDAVATAYNNATITGFIHYGNYQPTEWGIDVTTNSSNWDNANVSLSKSNTISSWNDSGRNISVNFGTDVAAANNPLKANTRYYYRFWVKYGNNQFAHSDVKEFTTPKNEPRFSTPSVTKGSGTNNIVLSSTITWPSTAIPVEWGADIATEYNDSSFQNVDTNFSRDITASLRSQYANGLPVSLNFASETAQTNMLQPGTKYWYRFWVRYQAGNDDRLFAHSDGETSFTTAGSSDTAVNYTIKYNANGGTGAPANQTKTHGTILTLSGTKPTRANSSAGKYTVTLNANGGSVSPASMDAARTTSCRMAKEPATTRAQAIPQTRLLHFMPSGTAAHQPRRSHFPRLHAQGTLSKAGAQAAPQAAALPESIPRAEM